MPDVNEIIDRLREREAFKASEWVEGYDCPLVPLPVVEAAVREAAQPDAKLREGISRIAYCFDLAVGDDEFAIERIIEHANAAVAAARPVPAPDNQYRLAREVEQGFAAGRAVLPDQRLKDALEKLREIGSKTCCYAGDWPFTMCDCKYGGPLLGRPGGEQTGCPELRDLYIALAASSRDTPTPEDTDANA